MLLLLFIYGVLLYYHIFWPFLIIVPVEVLCGIYYWVTRKEGGL